MISSFKNITKSSSSAGLEIIILPDGTYELNLVILKKQKSILSIATQAGGITSFAEAAKLIGKLPVIAVINGKGIIHKKININETDTPATLINKILPNASLNDFIIQETPIRLPQEFISVIRLNAFTDIINELLKNKITTISECFLGPFVINDLLPLIVRDEINNENITIGNYQLQVREQLITDITPAGLTGSPNIKIGNDSVSQKLLVAFSGALTWFTENNNGVYNSSLIRELKEEFRQKQKFELRGWITLAAAFLILMVNYFVFNNYWSSNNEMNSQLQLMQSAMERYDTLKSEFQQKKVFLEQNGLLENSRTSFYADRLAAGLPSSIRWTGLYIHPMKKKKPNDESEALQFENKVISIAGNCQRSTELNDWMKKVKEQNWINDVTLINYKQDNARENGVFLIEVKTK